MPPALKRAPFRPSHPPENSGNASVFLFSYPPFTAASLAIAPSRFRLGRLAEESSHSSCNSVMPLARIAFMILPASAGQPWLMTSHGTFRLCKGIASSMSLLSGHRLRCAPYFKLMPEASSKPSLPPYLSSALQGQRTSAKLGQAPSISSWPLR